MTRRREGLLPALLLGAVAVAYLGPLLYLAVTSLSGVDGDAGLSLDAFRLTLGDPSFRRAIALSGVVAAVTVGLQLAAAVPAALLTRSPSLASLTLRSILAATYFLPTTTLYAVWSSATDPITGPLVRLTRALGVAIDFRGERLAPVAIVAIGSTEGFGFVYLVVLVRLLQIPRSHWELAAGVTNSRWRTFRHLTWAHLRPVLTGLAVLRGAITFAKFDAPWLAFAQHRPSPWADTTAVWIYRHQFELPQPGMAAAASVLITLLLASTVLLAARGGAS